MRPFLWLGLTLAAAWLGVFATVAAYAGISYAFSMLPASRAVTLESLIPRKSGLTKALQEYGRLRKTIFLLRYMEDQDLRKRIGRQLNKGESLHALRDFLFFANAGKVGRRHPEKQTDQALCLNLVADCVILWKTIYYEEILTRLKDEGYPLKGGDVDHLSPTKYAHVNPNGRYRFDPGAVPAGELRPQRNC
jgi:hypothetical protein